MGALTFRSVYASTVPPDAALAWFFDLTEADHADPRFAAVWGKPRPGDGRTIVSRAKDEVVLRERHRGSEVELTTRAEGRDELVTRGTGTWRTEARLRFLPHGGGTRIEQEYRLDAGGLAGLLLRLLGRSMTRQLRQDMELHVRLMEEDWARERW